MSEEPRRRTLKDRMRPRELVGFAAVLSVFTGVVILVATRELPLASIFAGVVFIVVLLVMAMLALSAGEPRDPNSIAMLDRPLKPRKR